MHPHLRKLIDTRPAGNPDTSEFLKAIGDPQAAEAYRKAMGEEEGSTTADAQEPALTPDELERLHAADAALRETQEKKDLAALKADYLAWAREFNLGGDDPQEWIEETFTFNTDGTVETQGDLFLSNSRIDRLPQGLVRVNGNLSLQGVEIVDLDGLPNEIYDNLNLSGIPVTTLDGLRGKRIGGDLWLRSIPVKSIPDGIELAGRIVVGRDQPFLTMDARAKGYAVIETI